MSKLLQLSNTLLLSPHTYEASLILTSPYVRLKNWTAGCTDTDTVRDEIAKISFLRGHSWRSNCLLDLRVDKISQAHLGRTISVYVTPPRCTHHLMLVWWDTTRIAVIVSSSQMFGSPYSLGSPKASWDSTQTNWSGYMVDQTNLDSDSQYFPYWLVNKSHPFLSRLLDIWLDLSLTLWSSHSVIYNHQSTLVGSQSLHPINRRLVPLPSSPLTVSNGIPCSILVADHIG